MGGCQDTRVLFVTGGLSSTVCCTTVAVIEYKSFPESCSQVLRAIYFSSKQPILHVVLDVEPRQGIRKMEAFICEYQRAHRRHLKLIGRFSENMQATKPWMRIPGPEQPRQPQPQLHLSEKLLTPSLILPPRLTELQPCHSDLVSVISSQSANSPSIYGGP
jgi:hypothetical protein